MTQPAYRIESVDKVLRLLHMFRDKPRWTVSEVSEALGVVPSTAHRLLAMLQWHGFAHQEPGSKAYVAGRALVVIGLAALSELAVRDVARAELEALSRELGETVHLIVLQGPRTLIVDAVEGDQVVRVGGRIGGSAPPNCVSAGKVLLSKMTDRQVAALIGPDPLPRRTSRSIGTLAELTADLARVRERGYATNFDEHEFGATGISVRIPVPPGVTPAAITVNAPSARVPDERIPGIVAAAAAAAARIAAKLDSSLDAGQPAAPPSPPRSSPARSHRRPASSGSRRDHPAGRPYDRLGLISLADRYLAALVANDPGAVPLADGLRTVENLQRIKPGQGLWATASGGPAAFAVHVPDPLRQTVGLIGMMEQRGGPVLLGLRLAVEDGRIAEAEHLFAAGLAEAGLPNLRVPRPGLLAHVPPGQRLPGEDLRAIGATYYDALAGGDSSLAPFAVDCERHENGLVAAGPSRGAAPRGSSFPAVPTACAAQIDSKVFTYIAGIEHRRVFAADPVTGLAMGLSMFRHPMDNVPYEVILADGTTTMYAPAFAPFDLPAAHIWKIGPDRQIHEIEAMGFTAPYGSPTGW